MTIGLVACSGHPRSIFGVEDPRDHGSVGGSAPAPLIGSWRVVLVIDGGGDVQEWTTVWRFAANGQCHLTRAVRSFLEGVTRTTDRDCAFVDRGSTVVVTYADTKAVVAMPYAVPPNSTNRLVIEGVEYERIS